MLSLHQIWLPRSKKFQKFFGLYIALLLVTIVAIWAIWGNQTQIQWLEFSWHYWPSISQWFIGVGAGEYYRSWTESLTVFLNNTPALQQNHPTFLRIIIELGILGFIGFIFLLLVAIPYKERPIGTLLVIFSGIFLLPLLISTPNGILCLMTFASMRKFIKARQLKLDL